MTSSATKSNNYLCLFHLITAGLLDENLGSDEQDILELVFLIIDTQQKKTAASHREYIRPLYLNKLTDECREVSGIDEEILFASETDFESAVKKFDQFLRDENLHPDTGGVTLTFVCANSFPLRQCFHPESVKKSIVSLPDYYWSYFDLRMEFKQFYQTSECQTLTSMLEKLNLPSIVERDDGLRHVEQMELIVQQMLNDGYCFEKPELIMKNLRPGLCSIDDTIEESTVIRARGLPWQCTDQDVAKFFRGLDIAKGGVALCLSNQGRRNGEALVRFTTVEQRELALRRHKHHIGSRYIEVYKAAGRDFLNIAGGSNSEAQAFLQRDGQVIIRMRGLPFDATARDVIEFFTRGDSPISIVDGEEGVLFVHYPDGRSTGDAFVMVKSESDVSQVLLKHKETMGTRYIELFRSTTAEVQQVFRRSQDPKNFQTTFKDIPYAPLPMIPPDMLSGGNKKDCIRVRHLPIECGIEQILEFLGVHSQHIVAQGVHMVYNVHGQPSGEAFIQMNSEIAAFNATNHKNNKYLFFNGKKFYIEVLQCSGEEMNQILLGIVPSNLIPTNLQAQTMYSPHRVPSIVPVSTLPHSQLLPTSSATTLNTPSYYPMQVIYYPTPSIYLQTGQMHPGQMTLLLQRENGQY